MALVSGWASRGGPCQHLYPSDQAGSRKSLSREEVREMDPEGAGLAGSQHVLSVIVTCWTGRTAFLKGQSGVFVEGGQVF